MYDLGSDPRELLDLADEAKARVDSLANQSEALLVKFREQRARYGEERRAALSPAERRALRELGYAGDDD